MLLCVGVYTSRAGLPNPVVCLAVAFGLRINLLSSRGFYLLLAGVLECSSHSLSAQVFVLVPLSMLLSFTYDDDSERPRGVGRHK